MPTVSGYAFHFINQGDLVSTDYGGTLPPRVAAEPNGYLIDGHIVDIAAISGTERYLIVEPGDYPVTEDQRAKRRGYHRS